MRKKLRSKYAGACALEYESTMQVVLEVLIGWNDQTHKGTNGIFGEVEAYGDSCEEQARFTLHSHISLWIKDFNKVRDLLFHRNGAVFDDAKLELEKYFEMVSQASFSNLNLKLNGNDNSDDIISTTNDCLQPPLSPDIRDMRHHVHCKALCGVIGYYCQTTSDTLSDDITTQKLPMTASEIVEKNLELNIGDNSKISFYNLTELRLKLIQKGDKENLVEFLSGMGGTGKSEVIQAFVYFVKNISSSLEWVYDETTIAITAYTGAAACEIPHGKMLHSQGCLFVSDNKITQEHKDRWARTRMLIIDKISLLSVSEIKTLDNKMRILTEIEAMYGKVHVVFVGDFF